jgi:hypothetical protein
MDSTKCSQSPVLLLSNNAIVVFLMYVIMRLVMRYKDQVAKTRAIFIFLCVSLYTLVFGYGPPTKLNPMLSGKNVI